MTMTIPNTFTTASGNLLLSLLDGDFSSVASYVNAREVTFGSAASRPASGVSGQFYFATDTGAFSGWDAGASTWRNLSNSISPVNFNVTGLTALTTATTYPASMNQALMVNPANGQAQRATTVSVTNTITTANNLNGTDGSALASGQWLHFYIIGNGSATASVSSTTAPPTGPNLSGGNFSGYVYWAYLGAVWNTLNTGSLRLGYQRGTAFLYQTAPAALSSGSALTETAVSLTTFVPPNGARTLLTVQGALSDSGSAANNTIQIRVATGAAYTSLQVTNPNLSAQFNSSMDTDVPNVSQSVFYIWTVNNGNITRSANINVRGYTVPNGDAG